MGSLYDTMERRKKKVAVDYFKETLASFWKD
jgi:hypothetical protein